jgi:hypothetical protein
LKPRMWLAVLALFVVAAGAAYAGSRHFSVQTKEFAPFGTPLITAEWVDGIGCPSNARTAAGNAQQTAPGGPGPAYTDPACANGGKTKDRKVQGLLLSKTGPTANFASAQAIVKKPPRRITELGWDIRKPGAQLAAGVRGSHCGAGAPRWNITTTSGQTVFIGCNSPPATTQTPGVGFVRLRWAASTPVTVGTTATTLGALEVKKLKIVFDEGYDSGPSNFGLAVLDNIDVNGKLIGSENRGKRRHDDDDDDD